jgi:ribonuclease P protein component
MSDERRAGFVASKKVGGAVVRNRAKRRLRAVWTELQDSCKGGTYVFVAKEACASVDYKKLKSSTLWAMKRLGCLR